MTISKAKTKVAGKYGYRSWKEAMRDLDADHWEVLKYEAAEMYSLADRSKTMKVCKAIFYCTLAGLFIWALLWVIGVSKSPMSGGKDYSGYFGYQDKRIN